MKTSEAIVHIRSDGLFVYPATVGCQLPRGATTPALFKVCVYSTTLKGVGGRAPIQGPLEVVAS